MISLYIESDYDALATCMLKHHMTHPLNDPLQEEWIVVQNFDQATWLQLKQARDNQIAANNRFLLPSELFWALYRQQDSVFPKTLPSDRYPLQWSIYELVLDDPYMQSVCSLDKQNTPKDIFEKRCWQFSEALADVFDQYQVFRPDLVNGWEQGNFKYDDQVAYIREIEAWQAYVWKRVIADDAPTRGKAYHHLMYLLESGAIDKSGLPERISVFGTNDVSNAFHELIKGLGKHVDVRYYIKSGGSDEAQVMLNSKFGEANAHDEVALAFFKDHLGKDSLKEPVISPVNKQISINCCHSPRREVQELKRHILTVLDNDNQIQANDILIAVSDLDTYTPYLREEFGSNSAHPLPISLPSDYHNYESKLYAFLDHVLSVLGSRYEASAFLDLLSSEFVRTANALSDNDISTIRRWVSENNIRWGLNTQHVQAISSISHANHSWEHGIRKILLGSVTEFEEHDVWNGLAAYPYINTSDFTELAFKVQRILRAFGEFEGQIQSYKTTEEWLRCLSGLFYHLLDDNALHTVDVLFGKIREEAKVSGFSNTVAFQIVSECIKSRSSIVNSGAGAFGRGIIISSYIPLQTVPFEYVAVLGLNEGVLPHVNRRPSFDLLKELPEKGDRNSLVDDHMLFLNLYDGAKSHFYTSYVGFNEFDDAESAPSVLLQYLIDFQEEQGTGGVNYHRLQSFSSEYLEGESDLYNYSPHDEAIYRALREEKVTSRALLEPTYDIASMSQKVSIQQLCSFFINPDKYLCTNDLNLFANDTYIQVSDDEQLEADGLLVHQLQQLLKYRGERSFDDIANLGEAIGILSAGRDGALTLSQIERSFLPLWNKILAEIENLDLQQKELLVKLNGVEIYGTIEVSDYLLIHVLNGKLRPRHIIKLWIQYLVGLASGLPIQKARVYYIDKTRNKAAYLDFEGVADYESELKKLLKWKDESMKSRDRLVLFEQSSFDYFKTYSDPKNRDTALQKALNTWLGNAFSPIAPESQDYYHRLIHGDINPLRNPAFSKNAIEFWEPVFNFKEEGTL